MERRLWIRPILIGFLAIAVLVAGSIVFLSQMEKSVWEEQVDTVLEVTEQGSKSIEIYLEQGNLMLEGRAANFAPMNSSDEKAIGDKLDMYESGDPSFAIIDLTHGTKHFNSDSQSPLSSNQKDLLEKLPSHGVLEPFQSDYNGLPVVGYYQRFTFADGAEGMALKTIPLQEMAETFSLSFYDGAGFSYVVSKDGEILVHPKNEAVDHPSSNIFDLIGIDNDNPEKVEELRRAIDDGKDGVMRLDFDGKDFIFAYVPIANTDGWYLVSLIPNNVVMDHASNILKTTQVFVVVIVVAALLFIWFIISNTRHRRQMRDKETEVMYREQMFNMLANKTNDAFIMLSANCEDVLYVSPNIKQVMGVDPEKGKKDLKLLQSVIRNNNSYLDIEDIRKLPLGDFATFDGSFIHPETGETRWYNETTFHMLVEGTERFMIVIADRTEERQKELTLKEALEVAKVANESKSTFLSNMSHDIRTPMNAIVGISTLLQRDADDPERVRQHTRKITSSSQHLLGLINDVLDMSKIESGKTALNIGSFSLPELVEELGTIIRPQANARKQTFDVVVKDIQDEHLLGDKLRLNQVMINILSNAVKYTPVGGSIVMRVQQLGESAPSIARIRFVVEDNGIGMSEEYQKQIFQPFTREVQTVVNKVQGTGLGMAITKSLVDLMGGSIYVDSVLEEGTTFTLDFDLRIDKKEDDEDFFKKNGIEHALVVDDEIDICTSVMSTMAGTGVAMEFALDGQTAVNMTKAAHDDDHDFDVILLDWKMPGMDGIETARRIRAAVPRHIPIMIITSYDFEEIRDEGIAAGIDGFLSKPFFLSTFKEVIRTIKAEEAEGGDLPDLEGALEGRHFLYAEDNDLNAMILTDLLDMEGATCDRAVDGQDVLEIFTNKPAGTYDAILMDVQMPIMNGYEATEAIRVSSHPEAKSIPIIALTANAFADDVHDAISSGMNAHVAKPVDMTVLAETLAPLWNKENQ